jgi:hypothetical protein
MYRELCSMTPEEFVEAIRSKVLISAVTSTISNLAKVPPRGAPELRAANAWFDSLADEERAHLRYALTLAAHHAVFGFLAVIDGVRVVERTREKGTFRLTFLKEGQEWQLSPSTGEYLHELLPFEP